MTAQSHQDGGQAPEDRRSIDDPEGFWAEAARSVRWIHRPTRVLDGDRRWFPDGTLNTCFNALDRHVIAGAADRTALIHDSSVTGTTRSYTYAQLLDLVSRFAGVLQACGVEAGDGVLIHLPSVPEAVIAMLGCARIGAVHAVVPAGSAPAELALRIDDARPKVIVSASGGIEPTEVIAGQSPLDEALRRAEHQPDQCIIVQRPPAVAELGERDLDWATLMRPGTVPAAACVPVAATDPLYLLPTLGPAGRPQRIVRANGSHAVALIWSMTAVFDLGPGDVMFTAADLDRVVGHCGIVYGPLLAGATAVLCEGEPDAGAFWRVIAEHRVNVLLTTPTALAAIRRLDPGAGLPAQHDVSSLRTLFLAGERLDPDSYAWATEKLGVPVVDNLWPTETDDAIHDVTARNSSG